MSPGGGPLRGHSCGGGEMPLMVLERGPKTEASKLSTISLLSASCLSLASHLS